MPTAGNTTLDLVPPVPSAKVPAASLHHFGALAREEAGQQKHVSKQNASRDTHRFIRKWGLAWNVPLSWVEHMVDDEATQVAYISPLDFVKFLVRQAPELLMGGTRDQELGQKHLEEFWGAYQKVHPTHVLFHADHSDRRCCNTFALALHGDEGRGLKKGNTTIITVETCLGVNTASNTARKRSSCECNACDPNEVFVKRIRLAAGTPGVVQRTVSASLCQFQATNIRQHSYLTKFALAVLPKKDGVLLDKLTKLIVKDMKSLFEEGVSVGGQHWFGACVGMKGDQKWFQKVGGLQRAFHSQISVGALMCHECLAGSADRPFEDSSHHPCWEDSCYTVRPFIVPPTWCFVPFEAASDNVAGDVLRGPCERFFRRDAFHITKVGIMRYMVASSVMLCARLRYFHQRPGPNDRESLLQRAHAHFVLFCKTTRRTPALRSFTPVFFNSKTWDSYGWVNCKASDTSILLSWLSHLLTAFLNDPLAPKHVRIFRRMKAAVDAAKSFSQHLFSHQLWWPKSCGWTCYTSIHEFLVHYNGCAFLAMHEYQFCGFAMTGKFHALAHIKTELLALLQDPTVNFVLSPAMWQCDMNEDIIGKLSRLNRRVSAQRSAERTLQLYLTKSKAVHKRFLKTCP